MLLNVLGASDGESILVLVVEEDRERGRVYGGSQAGDIHVSARMFVLKVTWRS